MKKEQELPAWSSSLIDLYLKKIYLFFLQL